MFGGLLPAQKRLIYLMDIYKWSGFLLLRKRLSFPLLRIVNTVKNR